MPGRADYSLQEYALTVYSSAIGTGAVTVYVVVPWDGTLIETRLTPHTTLGASSTTTVSILPAGVAANAITVGGTVVASAASAAGSAVLTRHTGTRSVSQGDVIRLAASGSAGASAGVYTLLIKR